MGMTTDRPVVLAGPGTPAVEWQRWAAPRTWPPLDLGTASRALVVVPHPDDAVVALGGTLKLLVERGCALRFVDVTDGEDSHPFTSVLDHDRMAAVRCDEQRRAHERLGLRAAEVVRLRLPDGDVAAHGPRLAHELASLTASSDLCIAPWDGDGHPDHDAVGAAAAAATGASGCTLWSYPMWMWHWAAPGDGRIPWDRARRVDLPPRVRAAKARAVQAFASQMRPLGPNPEDVPVLPEPALQRFDRPYEIVFTA